MLKCWHGKKIEIKKLHRRERKFEMLSQLLSILRQIQVQFLMPNVMISAHSFTLLPWLFNFLTHRGGSKTKGSKRHKSSVIPIATNLCHRCMGGGGGGAEPSHYDPAKGHLARSKVIWGQMLWVMNMNWYACYFLISCFIFSTGQSSRSNPDIKRLLRWS